MRYKAIETNSTQSKKDGDSKQVNQEDEPDSAWFSEALHPLLM